jgi:hypothetical protein
LSPTQALKIVGPSFSGSLPSLDQALDSEKIKADVGFYFQRHRYNGLADRTVITLS